MQENSNINHNAPTDSRHNPNWSDLSSLGSDVASLMGNQVSWKTFINKQKLFIFAHFNLGNLVSFIERPVSEFICDRRKIAFALNAYYIHSDIEVSEQEHQVDINLQGKQNSQRSTQDIFKWPLFTCCPLAFNVAEVSAMS